jgi:hypothetical protein
MALDASPDFRLNVEDMIMEGDLVFVRLTMTGTQQGEFSAYQRPASRSPSQFSTAAPAQQPGCRALGHQRQVPDGGAAGGGALAGQ